MIFPGYFTPKVLISDYIGLINKIIIVNKCNWEI